MHFYARFRHVQRLHKFHIFRVNIENEKKNLLLFFVCFVVTEEFLCSFVCSKFRHVTCWLKDFRLDYLLLYHWMT